MTQGMRSLLQGSVSSVSAVGGTDLGSDAVTLQVNGINVEGLRHSEVVSHIKSRENEARLLVVDPETDDYFKKLGVTPTEEHTKGETSLSLGDSTPFLWLPVSWVGFQK